MENPKKRSVLKIVAVVLAVIILAGCGVAAHFYGQIAQMFDEGDSGKLNQKKTIPSKLPILKRMASSFTTCFWWASIMTRTTVGVITQMERE